MNDFTPRPDPDCTRPCPYCDEHGGTVQQLGEMWHPACLTAWRAEEEEYLSRSALWGDDDILEPDDSRTLADMIRDDDVLDWLP